MKYMIYCKIENERISFESLANNYPIMVARLKEKYNIENVMVDDIESEISFNFKGETAKYFGTIKPIKTTP